MKEEWKNGALSGTSKVIGGDNYELRIAGMDDGGSWKIAGVRIVDNPGRATIKVLPQTEKGWMRIVIKSSKSQNVKWQLRFMK